MHHKTYTLYVYIHRLINTHKHIYIRSFVYSKMDSWRLFLDEDFEKCKTTLGGLTFVKGPLSSALPNEYFKIDSIEVWGWYATYIFV